MHNDADFLKFVDKFEILNENIGNIAKYRLSPRLNSCMIPFGSFGRRFFKFLGVLFSTVKLQGTPSHRILLIFSTQTV